MENDLDLEFAAMTVIEDVLPKEKRRIDRLVEYEDTARVLGFVATTCFVGVSFIAELAGSPTKEVTSLLTVTTISFGTTLGGLLPRFLENTIRMANKLIYLDYAAATPIDKRILAAMQPYFSDRFYNPSASYIAARQVEKNLDTARSKVAQILGAKPAEIDFTAGGTEANNLAIRGVLEQFSEGNVVVSAIEHESVLEPAKLYSHKIAPVGEDGIIDLTKLEKLINEKTVLVSVMYANNEVGTIEPIRQAAEIVKAKRSKRKSKLPLYLHTDAAQAANYLDLHVSRLGIDMMTINGGKIYGPKQSGALFIKSGTKLKPQILGGGQENGLRSGTENVAGIVGFAEALELTQTMRKDEVARLIKIQQEYFKLLQQNIPRLVINGSLKHRLPNNVHITVPGQDNERVLFALDDVKIMAAAGSACSASDEEPSHVLKAMGVSDADAQASLRFTIGRQTTENDIKTTVKALAKILAKQ